MLSSRFVVAAWFVLGMVLVGAALSISIRPPAVGPAWAGDSGANTKDKGGTKP